MNEPQLVQGPGAEGERVGILLAETAVQAVHQQCQGHPLRDQVVETTRTGLEGVTHRLGLARSGSRLNDMRRMGGRRFQQVHHVEVVRPGLGPVFPGVGRGVGAHESLGPVGGRVSGGFHRAGPDRGGHAPASGGGFLSPERVLLPVRGAFASGGDASSMGIMGIITRFYCLFDQQGRD